VTGPANRGSWLPRRRDLADLVDRGRGTIVEHWESPSALETFHSKGPDTELRPVMLTVSVPTKLTTTALVTVDGVMQGNGGAGACLFGRRTYEIFAGYWGAMEDPGHPPGARSMQPPPTKQNLASS
jgi:hypothetical protein